MWVSSDLMIVWYSGGLYFFFQRFYGSLICDFLVFGCLKNWFWIKPKTLSQNPHKNPHLQPTNFPKNTSTSVLSVNLSNTHLKLELGTTKSDLIWLWIRDPKLTASYSRRWWWNYGGCGGGVHAGHGGDGPAFMMWKKVISVLIS